MQYKIVYDQPGRLRVRYGPNAFTPEQGYGIAAQLLTYQGIREVNTCAVNGSVLVLYEGSGRAWALQALSALRPQDLPVADPRDGDKLRQIDDHFRGQVIKLAAGHFLRKLLPSPMRMAYTLWRALGYWRAGVQCLCRGKLEVAVLDAASVGAALVQNQWKTASSVMFLLNLSGVLEEYTRQRARTALTQSLTIHVDTVWLVDDGGNECSLPMNQLQVGDCIRVRAGSLIPVDGMVTAGDAMVNESSMTGESMPVHKLEGRAVYAGTVLEEGCLTIRVTALAEQSRIQQIVDLIESSEAPKAKRNIWPTPSYPSAF